MGHDERLQAIHDIVAKLDRENGIILEKLDRLFEGSKWLEGRVDKLDEAVKPVSWLSQTGSVILWVCSLFGGAFALVKIISELK